MTLKEFSERLRGTGITVNITPLIIFFFLIVFGVFLLGVIVGSLETYKRVNVPIETEQNNVDHPQDGPGLMPVPETKTEAGLGHRDLLGFISYGR